MRVGSHFHCGGLIAAPMAGVTDRPFRMLCRRLGASYAVSEMISSNPALRNKQKTLHRANHAGEPEPRWVQIAGSEPKEMAQAAAENVERGAQIIDINMGCPAKKVCRRAAGSALLSDEHLVARILDAVVSAVEVPVTLKIRTGPAPANRNAVRIARLAEASGVRALTVHGRTRACGFRGDAEHDTARAIKMAVSLPVIANGDIDSPERALSVLSITGADAVMIGRAAQGNPWIFREISHYLDTGVKRAPPSVDETRDTLTEHLEALYSFYGARTGARIARKHLCWYLKRRSNGAEAWARINRVESPAMQLSLVRNCFAASQQAIFLRRAA